eukprot:CAMPEP_0172445356 /NCGR_PEP_ID=MMETSP1065-20121228/5189_1 /TAXON_ID=265537 /ORGANISM="Amphiprora paludosa, Strain CCMP125" /LENGTH=178 /DNA_ID=CAMNT_0013196159 /DNA_START=40 /DNA_END=576 /DNA_ORIENTATION=+
MNTRLFAIVAFLAASAPESCAWSTSSSQNGGAAPHAGLSRRQMLVAALTTTTTAVIYQLPAHAVLSTGACASGVGEGCADLSEGNAYIQALQEQSAANRERNEREARDAYYMKNYPDWFQTVGKTLVKKESDGTFVALDDKEVAALQRDNKLTLETAKSMGGRVVDYTQKPILVLKDL